MGRSGPYHPHGGLADLEDPRAQDPCHRPDIGGGFGKKVGAYPGYICAIVASIVTGRPVKWVEDRIEDPRLPVRATT
jgi:CO/xanthine dehydrogenase Mo-binding subunit